MDEKRSPSGARPQSHYAVGYGKPPTHSRFQPGQSGNPRGRRKGTKNLKTDLVEELNETVVVREGDRSRRVSKQRALMKSLVARTLKGDARAGNTLVNLIVRIIDTGAGSATIESGLNGDEQAILNGFLERNRRDELPIPPGPTTESRSDSHLADRA